MLCVFGVGNRSAAFGWRLHAVACIHTLPPLCPGPRSPPTGDAHALLAHQKGETDAVLDEARQRLADVQERLAAAEVRCIAWWWGAVQRLEAGSGGRGLALSGQLARQPVLPRPPVD